MAVILLLGVCAIFITTTNIFGSCYTVQNLTVPLIGGLDEAIWSVQENALYWADYYAPALFRMDGMTGEITNRTICYGAVGFVMPVQDYPGYILVGIRTSVYLLKWGAPGGDTALRQITNIDAGRPDNLIDEGKADAAGRLWFGSLGSSNYSQTSFVNPDEATLYEMDFCNYKTPVVKKTPVTWVAGIAFSSDNCTMYFNDAATLTTTAFDYNITTGDITNERVIFNFTQNNIAGVPDKLAIDTRGYLWISTFNTSIICINPEDGSIDMQIELPVDRVTGIAWGGCCLDILYATTSDEDEVDPQPLSGSLLQITGLGVSGVPTNNFVFPGASEY